jgi:hypothetical protein
MPELNPVEKLRNLLATTSPLPWTHTWSSNPTAHNDDADYVECPLPPGGKRGLDNVVMHNECYYNAAPSVEDMTLCVVAVNVLPNLVQFVEEVANGATPLRQLSVRAQDLLAELGRQIDTNS